MTSHSDVPQVPRRAEAKRPRRKTSKRWVRTVGTIGYSICGMGATVTPLVLWMSWSETSYYLTILGGFVSCCGIVLLSKYLPEYQKADAGDERERR